MREIVIKKTGLHDPEPDSTLKAKTPQELLDMMWQLALDAWSFKENLSVEPRLQRHVVTIKRGKR